MFVNFLIVSYRLPYIIIGYLIIGISVRLRRGIKRLFGRSSIVASSVNFWERKVILRSRIFCIPNDA